LFHFGVWKGAYADEPGKARMVDPGGRGGGDFLGGIRSRAEDALGKPAGVASGLPQTPAGLPELNVPADNPITAEKVQLGKML
jgi:hypothetical protein